MPYYHRIVGGFTDRGDRLDTVKGHIWKTSKKGEHPVAICGEEVQGFVMSKHDFELVTDPSRMCDGCHRAYFARL